VAGAYPRLARQVDPDVAPAQGCPGGLVGLTGARLRLQPGCCTSAFADLQRRLVKPCWPIVAAIEHDLSSVTASHCTYC
jgi:hypothetical protein